jgi:hypothetical protein
MFSIPSVGLGSKSWVGVAALAQLHVRATEFWPRLSSSRDGSSTSDRFTP